MQLTVALVSEEGAGVRALQLLIDRGHRVASVFTNVGGAAQAAPLVGRARSLDVPVRDAREVRNASTADFLRAEQVQLILDVHSLQIVDPKVLEAPILGAYNLHPGPLPEPAGLHVASWALYEGAVWHGVSLHRMTPEVDAGGIAFADKFEIGSADTGLPVMTRCIQRGIPLIARLVELAERGEAIPARPQDLASRRWFSAGPPHGGRLDWHRPARRIADFVRPCDYRPFASPWDFPRCTAGGKAIAILTARAIDQPSNCRPGTVAHGCSGGILVAAADGWVRVDKIKVHRQVLAAAEAVSDGTRLR